MTGMMHADVQEWLDLYIVAWRANQREPIEALFTKDALYRYRPYGGDEHTARGRDEIVQAWLDDQDDPESWEASYNVFAVDGERAVAVGQSRYFATGEAPERVFHNCFLLRFEDSGRCSELTEFYMQEQ
jgi:hypothetical protein